MNLFSVGSACDSGIIDTAVFTSDGCTFWKDGKLITTGERNGWLYFLSNHVSGGDRHVANVGIGRWHQRLCHVRCGSIFKMMKSKTVTGVSLDSEQGEVDCRVCCRTKMTQTPFQKASETRAAAPGHTLHVHLCGPMEAASEQGSRYAMPVTDDHSRFTIVHFLKRKSDALSAIEDAIKLVRNQTGNQVVNIHADN